MGQSTPKRIEKKRTNYWGHHLRASWISLCKDNSALMYMFKNVSSLFNLDYLMLSNTKKIPLIHNYGMSEENYMVLVYCCPSTVPSLWPPPPSPMYSIYRRCVTVWGVGGCWNLVWTIFCRSFTLCFWTDSEPTKLLHPPQAKMTSKDNIKGLVSLKFRPWLPWSGFETPHHYCLSIERRIFLSYIPRTKRGKEQRKLTLLSMFSNERKVVFFLGSGCATKKKSSEWNGTYPFFKKQKCCLTMYCIYI